MGPGGDVVVVVVDSVVVLPAVPSTPAEELKHADPNRARAAVAAPASRRGAFMESIRCRHVQSLVEPGTRRR
jgi:hypothetical protein